MAVRAEAKAGIVTNRPRDGFQRVVGIVASAVPALLLLIVLTLLQQAMPAIQHFGLAFVVNTDWNPVTENFDAAPAIFGTVFTAFLALALVLPVGLAGDHVAGDRSLRPGRDFRGDDPCARACSRGNDRCDDGDRQPVRDSAHDLPARIHARERDRQRVHRSDGDALPGGPDRARAGFDPRDIRGQHARIASRPVIHTRCQARCMNRNHRRTYVSSAGLGLMYVLTLLALIPLG